MDQDFLQWPFFDDAHRALAEKIEAWAVANLQDLSHAREDTDETCRRLVKKLGADGWLHYAVPGAAPYDLRSFCLIREVLARHEGLADFAFTLQGLGAAVVAHYGSEEQKAHYLPLIAAGEKIAGFALSEPGAGSDAGALTTSYVEDGEDVILNGCKTWISNGGIADFYTVFARNGESVGISAFLVEADVAGFDDQSRRIEVMSPHPLAQLHFTGCRIPKGQMIGAAGQGFKYAMLLLDVYRSGVGAAGLGFARRALDEALAHASQRQIRGGPMTDLQLVQAKIADMAVNVDASALLVYRAAWHYDQGHDRVTREAAMAKLFATEAAQEVVDEAVQIFGAAGVEYGHVMERLYREIRLLRIYEGASDIQKLIIARETIRETINGQRP